MFLIDTSGPWQLPENFENMTFSQHDFFLNVAERSSSFKCGFCKQRMGDFKKILPVRKIVYGGRETSSKSKYRSFSTGILIFTDVLQR